MADPEVKFATLRDVRRTASDMAYEAESGRAIYIITRYGKPVAVLRAFNNDDLSYNESTNGDNNGTK